MITDTYEQFELKRIKEYENNKVWFLDLIKSYFGKNPDKLLIIAQYADYWRDGETCEFEIQGVVEYDILTKPAKNRHKLPTLKPFYLEFDEETSYISDEEFYLTQVYSDDEYKGYSVPDIKQEIKEKVNEMENLFGNDVVIFCYMNNDEIKVDIHNWEGHQ